jgi:peptide deformylase
VAENATDQAELEPEELQPDEEPEPELDPEVAARRAAALAHVRKFGDPVLRTRARPVDRRMGAVMIDSIGVGLAANQVGILHRLLVYRVHQQSPVSALVNPEIQWVGDEQETLEEGCLSLPSVHVDVERPVHIVVGGFNEFGEPLTIEASGLEARVIQHEIDHLDGVLVLDRIGRGQRKEAMRALREALETS